MSETVQNTPLESISGQPEALDDLNRYVNSLHAGLDRAEEQGFDILGAVAQERDVVDAEANAERATRVIDTAVELAADLELDEEFFARPSNAVLLTAIADSWVKTTEREAKNQAADRQKITKERDMLVDVALILAGSQSSKVRELSQDPNMKDRYVEEIDDPDAAAREQFFDSINDKALADEVREMLKGDASIVAEQRERLGLTTETEQDFDVRVLKYATAYDLASSGVIERPQWPDPSDRSQEARDKGRVALEQSNENREFAEPYEAAQKEYEERFGEKYGQLPPAFVDTPGAGEKPVLYLMADTAFTIINYYRDGRPMPEDNYERKSIAGKLAIAQHEYAHTQKSLIQGPHNQLGLLLEERKAELVSGDHHGYNDIKDLFKDMTLATGINLVGMLDDSLKDEDALSSFVIKSANSIGLRNTLLLVADKPMPYEKNHDHARHFADFHGLKDETDRSSHDVMVRETLERLGDEKMRAGAEDWVKRVVENGTDLEFLQNFFLGYRESHGSTHGTGYLKRAIEDRIKHLEAATN